MTSEGPPREFDLASRFGEELASAPADERVYRVALQLYEPAGVSEIAERASCAPDTARRHLKRLADIGVIHSASETPVTYQRNESYFEWRLRNRLETLSASELRERLSDLTARERDFRNQFEADSPGDVDALEHADFDDVEDVWSELSEWRTVRQRIRRLEAVRRRRDDGSSTEGEAA